MVKRRGVVVTGLGVVSSIGIGKEAFWEGLMEGRSGVSHIERFDTSSYDVHVGGEVKDFRPHDFFDRKDAKRLGRSAQFAVAAARLALEDADIRGQDLSSMRTSICLGTTMAEAHALEALDDAVVKFGRWRGRELRRYALQYPSCMVAIHVALWFRVAGRVLMFPTACAAGNYSIAYGSDLIRLGKSDVVLAGGVDSFSRTAFTGFGRILALSPDRCRPFDKNRRGIIVGEGAGVLVLESAGHAAERGATPYAEVLGYGTSCDAHHMTIPSAEGLGMVMRRAMADAEIVVRDVEYINAHGTGTPANDRTECAAIIDVFGDKAAGLPISSIKSMVGHTMGAASSLEAVACAMAVRHNKIPPTINYETPDLECPIDCVPNVPRDTEVNVALNNSFAFGGNNACVVMAKAR